MKKEIIIKRGKCIIVADKEEDDCILDDSCVFDPDSGYEIADCDHAEELHSQDKGKKDCRYWNEEVSWLCPHCGEELRPISTSWIKCSEKMPEPRKIVFIYLKDMLDKGVITIAQWISRYIIEIEIQYYDGELMGEYNKESDKYFLKEGWYETTEYGDDEYNGLYRVIENVTHWQPLPKFPMEG